MQGRRDAVETNVGVMVLITLMRVQDGHERLETNITSWKVRTMDGLCRDSTNEVRDSSSVRLQDAKPSDNIAHLQGQLVSSGALLIVRAVQHALSTRQFVFGILVMSPGYPGHLTPILPCRSGIGSA